jgi:DNA-binding transcriptional regulator YiaG
MTGSDIREMRRELSMTQVEMGALIGVAGNTVARWERGELRPSPMAQRLIRIAAAEKNIAVPLDIGYPGV